MLDRDRFELITAWVQGEWVNRRDLSAALREVSDELDQQGFDLLQTVPHDPTEGGKTYDLRTRKEEPGQ